MNVKKRGLGRGLEVLLADTASLNTKTQQTTVIELTDHQPITSLPREQLKLLQEAENLKGMLDELAAMIRDQ